MKNLLLLFAALLMGTGTSLAEGTKNNRLATAAYGYSNSFVFQENGISFAVYPDGEFDFYINSLVGGPVGRTTLTFNGGFNYNPYVQYDDFGAVVQIQQVPVFYDYYGRVRRIGNIHISYRNGRMYRLGGMRVYYNSLGYYRYHVGYINPYNRFYVYQPFHGYFMRPATGFCMVYPQPYRRYYSPVRYTYYRPYYNNSRRAYARVGTTHRHASADRSRIYVNDSRVARNRSSRSSAGVQRTQGKSLASNDRSNRTVARSAGRHTTVKNKGASHNRSLAHRQSASYKGKPSGSATREAVRNNQSSRKVQGESKYTRAQKNPSKARTASRSFDSKSKVTSARKSVKKDDRARTGSRGSQKGRSRVARKNPR